MLPLTKNAGSPRKAVPLRGLFAQGVWRCNCAERPPAVRRQTKNHGVHHGRWFYTCQKSGMQQCRFFLWASDAEAREKQAVLSNSHTEPTYNNTFNNTFNTSFASNSSSLAPETPTKKPRLSSSSSSSTGGLLTPQTDRTVRFASNDNSFSTTAMPSGCGSFGSPPHSAKARMMAEDMDEFEWDDEDDVAVGQLLPPTQTQTQSHSHSQTKSQTQPQPQPQPQPPLRQPDFGLPKTPHRTERIPSLSSSSSSASFSSFPPPGKRKFSDLEDDGDSQRTVGVTPPATMSAKRAYTDHRIAPFSSSVPPSSIEFSTTPTPARFRGVTPGGGASGSGSGSLESSEVAAQAITALEKNQVVLTKQARDELVDLLNKYELKMKGIVRGRDISRIALKKKDEQIERLNERVKMLEERGL
ncbi:hypothetical protein BO70DRAFT_425380 [Aspergillus heteromorphus CBS 117.55]|uniref:GRF-type domain-containing protein n=1 Tax=Aspergillus heteromorphus CBS 117.55 TaxID=1448321 RepID=A0A317X286_9EURO|nr:uncharacterized protein BO70DRAFT_425380 [Aspergillus heteromorphus CBS 117.55]PWY92709.1 hypothetical protein BO70DRAFT_425380 [Aspergillus heteromorphus CBS 117.55]